MSRVLLDTDILSEILKTRDRNVEARATAYLATNGRFTLSAITAMEITYGLRRASRDKQLAAFEATLATCEVLAFDEPAGVLAGRIEADLERRGTPIDLGDVMIGAIAIRHALPVVTGNVAHYEAIRRAGHALEIENWRGA